MNARSFVFKTVFSSSLSLPYQLHYIADKEVYLATQLNGI